MIIARYRLDGYYMLDAAVGCQFGDLSLLSCGKLIGSVQDSIAGNGELCDKLFLGFRSPKHSTLSYVKMSSGVQRGENLKVVLWHLRFNGLLGKGGREESYVGGWVSVNEKFSLAEKMKGALLADGGPSVESLSSIPIGTLNDFYFGKEALKFCDEESKRLGQIGGLVLTVRE